MRIATPLFALIVALGGSVGCSSSSDSSSCEDGEKCDDPGSAATRVCEKTCKGDSACTEECREAKAVEHCEARQDDALESAQRAFTENHIRWACSDVEGVNTVGNDDRGQEYCEYYAIVQPPPKKAGDAALPKTIDAGHGGSLGVELNTAQIEALEDAGDAVVGQCVFTSWHADVNVPLPNASAEFAIGDDANLPPWATDRKLGFKLSADNAQMQVGINSNGAASDLVNRCLTEPPVADPKNAKDPLHQNYFRGCMKAFGLFQTEWRRSDPTICAVSMRLGECGCGVDTDGDGKADITDPMEIALGVVPPQPEKDAAGKDVVKLRGFRLGTWTGIDELPAGCRFVDTGDTSHTLVSCDLSAADLIASKNDPKARCREKYGDNVVVHLPIPAGALVCKAPANGLHTDTCGVKPWVIGDEGAQEPGGECCKTCGANSQACGDACIPKTSTCSKPKGCACNGPSGS